MTLAAMTAFTWPPIRDAPNHRFEVLSPGGSGFRNFYFDTDTTDVALLLVAHSLALIHVHPSAIVSHQSAPKFGFLVDMFRTNGGVDWFPFREQLNLFLVVRRTSRQNLIFVSRWDMDEIEQVVVYALGAQLVNRLIRVRREAVLVNLGCVCLGASPNGFTTVGPAPGCFRVSRRPGFGNDRVTSANKGCWGFHYVFILFGVFAPPLAVRSVLLAFANF